MRNSVYLGKRRFNEREVYLNRIRIYSQIGMLSEPNSDINELYAIALYVAESCTI